MAPRLNAALYWRLSNFYLFYFAALGALLPYWTLYLQSLGFDARAIGELMAVFAATKILSPNLWGWMADRSGRRMAVVRWGSLLALLCFAGVFLGRGYAWMALVMATFSFFWNAVLPQLEAVTLTHLGAHPQYYASIRVWGSIGFVVTAVGLGPWFDHHGTALLPLALLVLFAGIWGSTLLVPECAPPGDGGGSTPIGRVLRQPQVLAFLSVCFLMQASHAPYYTFYTLYLEAHGYSKGLIGTLWGLGVLAEIALFLGMHRLLPRAGTRDVLLASLALAALRWLIIGTLPENLPLLVLAQLLHAASFGTYHAAAIHLVHRLFVGSHQGRGQALYSSIGFGAGGAAGSLISGYLWVAPGPALTYAWAAGTALLALGIAWLGLRTMK